MKKIVVFISFCLAASLVAATYNAEVQEVQKTQNYNSPASNRTPSNTTNTNWNTTTQKDSATKLNNTKENSSNWNNPKDNSSNWNNTKENSTNWNTQKDSSTKWENNKDNSIKVNTTETSVYDTNTTQLKNRFTTANDQKLGGLIQVQIAEIIGAPEGNTIIMIIDEGDVKLVGKVKSEEMKIKIGQAIQQIKGVKSVHNKLEVKK